ncbi:PepSY-associated TM helix domain-containing protein [Laceyella putida]|uniref:PepSY-associated TM helix domain-containing protein n=1 Tax=Laceyella putida TaxID=110101 RepID=A0ABW2RLH8_9BACL
MKKARQLHLWIGLISSVLILIQAITGLIISEPWLIGEQSRGKMTGQMMPNRRNMNDESQNVNNEINRDSENEDNATSNNQNSQNQNPNQGNPQSGNEFGGGFPQERMQKNNFLGFIKGLHEGHIGGLDLRMVVDIAAVSLIILTVTGITLSIKILKAQAKRNKRQKEEMITE